MKPRIPLLALGKVIYCVLRAHAANIKPVYYYK